MIHTQYCSPGDINTQLITSSEIFFFCLACQHKRHKKKQLKLLVSRKRGVKMKTIHQIRNGDKKGGGVYMFLYNTLEYKLRRDFSINTIDNESLPVEIINKKTKNVVIHVLYRPPCGKIKPFKSI